MTFLFANEEQAVDSTLACLFRLDQFPQLEKLSFSFEDTHILNFDGSIPLVKSFAA